LKYKDNIDFIEIQREQNVGGKILYTLSFLMKGASVSVELASHHEKV